MKFLRLLLCFCLASVASSSPLFGGLVGGVSTAPPAQTGATQGGGLLGPFGSFLPGLPSLPGSGLVQSLVGGIQQAVDASPIGQLLAMVNMVNSAAGMGTAGLSTAVEMASQTIAAATNATHDVIKGSVQIAQTGIKSGKAIADNTIGAVESMANILPIKSFTDAVKPVVNNAFDTGSKVVDSVGDFGIDKVNKINTTLSAITNAAKGFAGALGTATQGVSRVTGIAG